MPRRIRLVVFALLLTLWSAPTRAQTPAVPAPTAAVREVRAEGLKSLTQQQVLPISGLQLGTEAGRDDLQAAADRLVQSGLFARVTYKFQSRPDGLIVTFQLEEAERIPAYFDNLPWFTDGELNDAIHAKLPFYDGKLPTAGAVVDQAAEIAGEFLAAHGLQAAIDHQVIANPNGEGNIQEFHIDGAALKISSLEFSDPSLNQSKMAQQEVAELKGKPYSRMAIDLFLAEQVRPIYQKQGYLRAKLGPPEVRLTGNPNQKLPEQIPVFIPITPGPVYKWKGVEWSGNSLLASTTLTSDLGLKDGDIADGMAIEAGLDRVREEYGHVGYLDAKIDLQPLYDDQAHTLFYRVRIEEGKAYKFDALTITGLSPTAEKRLRDAWTIPQGELFDKAIFEELLIKLETKPVEIFHNLPVHYESVGHWIQPDQANHTVNVLLDFK